MDHSLDGLTTIATTWDVPHHLPLYLPKIFRSMIFIIHVLKRLQKTNTRYIFSIITLKDQKKFHLQWKCGWDPILMKKEISVKSTKKSVLWTAVKFMYSSKDGLAWKLPVDKFIYHNNHFATWPEEDKALFRKKGYFHYCYVDSHTKNTGGGLPARDKWTPTRCNEVLLVSVKKNTNMHG